MQSQENCGVCGKPLVYGTQEVLKRCNFCNKEFPALIYCPEGHYVCDACHSRGALDILRDVLNSTVSADPAEILEKVMSHPSVPMHGPEHHAMVPAIIVTAVKNAGHPVPAGAMEKALERGSKVPGGWCGFYGACGAGIGVGTAVSVITGATPLTGKTRALANEATAFALGKMVDGGARCCKRASRKALEAAVEFLKTRMNINLNISSETKCSYVQRNRECIKEVCPYYDRSSV
ncbi:MAG: hypothetical protein A2Z15_06660 [Chloroflexi bacterium RBG_16_50_11]|nr:MAG: hypothetical protein A2Z15_06660 [Chloroflexi bacterium RBG_16_50_11]